MISIVILNTRLRLRRVLGIRRECLLLLFRLFLPALAPLLRCLVLSLLLRLLRLVLLFLSAVPVKKRFALFLLPLFPPPAAAAAAVFCVTCLTCLTSEPSLSRAPANASRTSRSNTAPFCALNRFPATVLWALGEQSANTPVSYVELRNDAFLWCAAPSQYPWSAAATTNFVTKKRELFNADHAHSSVQPGTNTTNVNGASFSLASVRTRSIVSATRRITPLTNGGFTCAGAAFEGAGVGEFEEIPSRAERRVDVRKRRTKAFRVVAVQWGRERLERHARGGAKRRENARPDAGLKAVPLDGLVPEQKREQTRVERAASGVVFRSRGVRLTRARLRLLLRVQRTGGGVFVVRVRMIRIGAVRTNAPSPRL